MGTKEQGGEARQISNTPSAGHPRSFDNLNALRNDPAMRTLLICLALTGCTQDLQSVEMTERSIPQTQEEIAFVSRLFNDIQPVSIADKREYCGLIGMGSDGQFVATKPRRGKSASCLPPSPKWQSIQIIASYHTHGAADLDYFTEIPSFDDMRTDIEDDTDGYIATPGGRFWYVDARARVARQLCGIGCITSDPAHVEDPDMIVQQTYTLQDLLEF